MTSEELAEEVPLTGMRAVIARRMTESLQSSAQLTLHRRIQSAGSLELRQSFDDPQPTLNDIILAAVARTLIRHPVLNATCEGDVISRWRSVHLGVAVAVESGLVVPIVRRAETLTVRDIQEQTDEVVRRAREGQLSMRELTGGTFTVSNLGAFGIDGFTPIVNPPQVAILGVGCIREGEMTVSLTIDHRAVDGADGARFLQDLAEVLEHPHGVIS